MHRLRQPIARLSIDAFGVCHLLLWLLCAYLFHQQVAGAYPADTRAHMLVAAGVEKSIDPYSMLHAVLRLASGVVDPPNCMSPGWRCMRC